MNTANPQRIQRHTHKLLIGGMQVDALSRAELVEEAFAHIKNNHRGPRTTARLMFDANGHALSLYARDSKYRKAVEEADIVHADGGSVASFSRFISRRPIPERSATTDMIHDFADASRQNETSFFLLGATEEVNAQCAALLIASYPGLVIAGRHHGYFGDLDKIVSLINESKADIVWVGLGKPYEQKVAVELRDRVNSSWLITCGGCFNYVTGAYKRAPQWMQRLNLEWLHRLATNPRQLLWRYFLTNPHALWLMLSRSKRTDDSPPSA